jgi:hypothetical protein
VKDCQIVQNNWSPSPSWEMLSRDELQEFMDRASVHFGGYQDNACEEAGKEGYEPFGNQSVDQLISQAEVDALGVSFTDHKVYAIDVAFHKGGLNYGTKWKTINKLLEKYLRSIMCLEAYFPGFEKVVIFASPKINFATLEPLKDVIHELKTWLDNWKIQADAELFCNEMFEADVFEPVLQVAGDVADTAELFMRGYQLYKMFEENNAFNAKKRSYEGGLGVCGRAVAVGLKSVRDAKPVASPQIKIGKVAQTVLRKLLESKEWSGVMLENFQSKDWSRQVLHIQYPLLATDPQKIDRRHSRYYSDPLIVNGKQFYLCSQWYETSANNDRPYLDKFLKRYSKDGEGEEKVDIRELLQLN